MDEGKANVLSTHIIGELNKAFDQARTDKAIVILSGREGVFSGGLNLKEMQKGPVEAIALNSLGSKLARRILFFQIPFIGLATGHSIAMGAFFTACL